MELRKSEGSSLDCPDGGGLPPSGSMAGPGGGSWMVPPRMEEMGDVLIMSIGIKTKERLWLCMNVRGKVRWEMWEGLLPWEGLLCPQMPMTF